MRSSFSSRRDDSRQAKKRALIDGIVIAITTFALWLLIEETELCTRFFEYVAAHPERELDSIILAGMFSTVGFLVFAIRRLRETTEAERKAQDLAYLDALTGLPNRRALIEALESAVSNRAAFSCMLLDLDSFKQVNDVRGHAAGDQLLQGVGACLLEFAADDVFVARIGGDEFAVLLNSTSRSRADRLARLIDQRLKHPLLIEGRPLRVGVSMGLARHPDDASSAAQVFRRADVALYSAKASARGVARWFNTQMESTEQRRVAISEALREALKNGEVVPHYQPLVDLSSGEIVGYEVLSRWNSPALGQVSPQEFIPLAVEAGLINQLSRKVLERACREALLWPKNLRISFNIAPCQLVDSSFALQLLCVLGKTGLSPHRLELELTEEALVKNAEDALINIQVLKDQGVTIALDDFGTGYASLHHLRLLPFDLVKIDRSYVNSILSSEADRRMITAAIDFTHALGLPILAEGVESREQAKVLRTLGCNFAQGWFFGGACPAPAWILQDTQFEPAISAVG